MVLACKQSCKGMSCHVKEVHWKSENICGLEQLVPQTPIWQFGKVWYYVSLKKIVWYYTSLRVWYYTSLRKSVWYSTSLREYDTICMILCALPKSSLWGRETKSSAHSQEQARGYVGSTYILPLTTVDHDFHGATVIKQMARFQTLRRKMKNVHIVFLQISFG